MAAPAWSAKLSSSIGWRSREEARRRREGGDDADDLARHAQGHAQHGAHALLLVDVALRGARVGAEVVGAHRLPGGGGATDDALADGHAEQAATPGVRNPWAAA